MLCDFILLTKISFQAKPILQKVDQKLGLSKFSDPFVYMVEEFLTESPRELL
jgi:hypothetical protein